MSTPVVEILLEGFADEENLATHSVASYQPTISLVRTESVEIIVDPGTVQRQEEIVRALGRFNLAVSDITHIIHTHNHLDHVRNSGMFPDVPVIDSWATWQGSEFFRRAPSLPKGVRIMNTPGHSADSLTVFVDTFEGVVAICGDLLFWEGDSFSNKYAEDLETLEKFRKAVLDEADFVIPGHGPRFSVKN